MKSVLLLIFALSLTYSVLIGDWKSYDASNIEEDLSLKRILDSTLESFLSREDVKDILSTSDLHIYQVYSIERQVVNGLNYRFKVSLMNSKGKTIPVTWIVNYQPWNNEIHLFDWKIESNACFQESIEQHRLEQKAMEVWKFQDLSQNDEVLIKDIRHCLPLTNSPMEMEITDIYLHFSKASIQQTTHTVTFRGKRGQDLQLIQVTYSKPFGTSEQQGIKLESYTKLDNKARYEVIKEKSKLDLLGETIEYFLRIIDPNVYSQVNPPFLGAYQTRIDGKNLYYLSAIIQGSDHFLSHYEIWLKSEKDLESIDDRKDFELFSYVKLDISREKNPIRENLSTLVQENSLDCKKIPSYFVCSLYPHCTNQAFISEARCKRQE